MHDLDALRGFAMILGIVLHASLAFFPAWWVVKDSQMADSTWIDELEAAIHGFRMPLFFLLSGFFTTMLWRRRGLPAVAYRPWPTGCSRSTTQKSSTCCSCSTQKSSTCCSSSSCRASNRRDQ